MSKRMNWRNASLSSKRSLSVRDEREYRDNDAASRWLERNECKHCGSVLSAVTFECVRGKNCPGNMPNDFIISSETAA